MKRIYILIVILSIFLMASCIKKHGTTCVCRNWAENGKQIDIRYNVTSNECYYWQTHYSSTYVNDVQCRLQ